MELCPTDVEVVSPYAALRSTSSNRPPPERLVVRIPISESVQLLGDRVVHRLQPRRCVHRLPNADVRLLSKSEVIKQFGMGVWTKDSVAGRPWCDQLPNRKTRVF
jgi:hypothetical protein